MGDTQISKMLKDPGVQESFANAGIHSERWTSEIEDTKNPGKMIPNPESKQEFAFRKVADFIQEINGSEFSKKQKEAHVPQDDLDKKAEKDRLDAL